MFHQEILRKMQVCREKTDLRGTCVFLKALMTTEIVIFHADGSNVQKRIDLPWSARVRLTQKTSATMTSCILSLCRPNGEEFVPVCHKRILKAKHI